MWYEPGANCSGGRCGTVGTAGARYGPSQPFLGDSAPRRVRLSAGGVGHRANGNGQPGGWRGESHDSIDLGDEGNGRGMSPERRYVLTIWSFIRLRVCYP